MILLFTVCSIAQSVSMVVIPKISGKAITLISTAAIEKSFDMNSLFNILITLSIIYSIYSFSKCLGGYISGLVSENICYNMRLDISKKINEMTLSYSEKTGCGDIMNRIVNDIERISVCLAESFAGIASSLITFLGILYMMFSVSCEMSFISLFTMPVLMIVLFAFLKKSKKYFENYYKLINDTNVYIEESFSGIEEIKGFGLVKSFEKNFYEANSKMRDSGFKASFAPSFAMPIVVFINNVNYIISAVIGGYLVIFKNLDIGSISAFATYSGQLFSAVSGVSDVFGSIQSALISSTRILEFLNAPEEVVSSKEFDEKVESFPEIEFKNVSFGYENNVKVINNFSLKIPYGKSVAIVGKTGAGKTTITKLLLKFYVPDCGTIYLGGKDVQDIPNDYFRKFFSVVTQDLWIPSVSVRENIRFGNLCASDLDVESAAKYVGAHHFIESLPCGYDTVIDENADGLSQGEKQLICIARLVVSKAPIAIFDEATASVDTRSERNIQKALLSIFKNKTSITIAHRLSTIRNSDIIVVMDEGKIIDFGTHFQLMDSCNIYKEMYGSQVDKI